MAALNQHLIAARMRWYVLASSALMLVACGDSQSKGTKTTIVVQEPGQAGGALNRGDEGDGGSTATETSDGGSAGAAAEEEGGSGATQTPLGPPGIRGVLVSETGQALANSAILACMATVCLFGKAGAGGRFEFKVAPRSEVALKTPEDVNATPRRGALLMPLVVQDGLLDVGTVYVPSIPEGPVLRPAAQDPQELEVGDGLALTLSRASLTPHLGDRLDDIAARQIPLARVRSIPGIEGEQLVGVYAIHPFAATSAQPIAVRAPAALPDGTAVKFRSISEIDGRPSPAALGVVLDGTASTAAGEGLTELTWLVISR